MIKTQFTSLNDVGSYQDQSLKELLKYLHAKSPFYKNHFASHAIKWQEILSVKDLEKIPVTTKSDLQNNNMSFLCVPNPEVVEYCSTSGTMGTPVTIALTENDLQRLALNEFLSFETMGAQKDDTIQMMLSLDRQFMAGIAYYLGARKLGAGIIRGGPGNFGMQLDTIQRLEPTILIAVPSFIASLIASAFENQVDLNKTSVKKILCIGENIRHDDFSLNPIGNRIINNWNVELYSTYASTEQQTAFTECQNGCGGHLQPGLLIFEILNEQNEQLPPGQPGELTITTLGVEGMPLLRYKTGDICTYSNDRCGCGRYTPRISPVLGRKNQLIKYKGTTLYPQTLFNALNNMELIGDYVVRVYRNDMETDDLELLIHLKGDEKGADEKIRKHLQSKLRIIPHIRFVPAEQVQKLQVSEGKRKISRLLDERSL